MKSIPQPIQLAFCFEGKVCTACQEWKPLSQYNKDRTHKDGLQSSCKPCKRARDSVSHAKHREARCKTFRLYYAANRDKAREWSIRYRAANPERRKESHKQWYMANRQYAIAKSAIYHRTHPEQVAKTRARWATANPENRRMRWHTRQAREMSAEGSYTVQEWQDLKARYGNRCLRCYRSEPNIRLTVDHVVPLSKGGTNYIHNIQPLCLSCNSGKRDRHICYRPDKLL